MNIVRKNPNGLLEYEERQERVSANNAMMRAAFISKCRHDVGATIERLAPVIAATKPLVVPMEWNPYKERLWDESYGRCKPAVTIRESGVSWSVDEVYDPGQYPSNIVEILKVETTIYCVCEPCWEAYKRWGTEIIDSFYRAMRAMREAYGLTWLDYSKVKTTYSFESVELRYLSNEPVATYEYPISEIEKYGKTYTRQVNNIKVAFNMTIPNTPESERDNANCHVVEEVVEVTERRKVKHLKCA